MRTIAACLLALLVGTVGAQEAAPRSKQVLAKVKLFTGDPRGSVEAGTKKHCVDTRVATLDGHPFTVLSGGQVPVTSASGGIGYVDIGAILVGTPRLLGDGMVRLDLRLDNTTVQ